ncbi:MAG: class I SAM-dependent methyltransferase [Bacteroidota bacterium]
MRSEDWVFYISVYHSPSKDEGTTPPNPDPELIAQQLRKPSGEFADVVADKMDKVNAPLLQLTLESLQLKDQESILEIGFGSGSHFEEVLNQAEGIQLTGLDHSQEMVKKAQAAYQYAIEAGKLDLHHCSSDQMPFPDATFDKIYCNMVIFFWDEPEQHLQEVRRVLKSGGLFFSGLRSKESMQKLPFTQHGFVIYEQEEWEDILRENGFRVLDSVRQLDPQMDVENQEMRMDSICVVAKKPVD